MAWQASSPFDGPALGTGHSPAAGGTPTAGGGLGVRLWWAIYLLLLPLYLGPSGYPQISHMYLAATAPVVLLICSRQVRIPNEIWISGLTFIVYVTCINLYWFSIYQDYFFVMTVFYFYFNFMSVLVIVSLFGHDPSGLGRVTRLVFLVGLGVEAAVVLVIGDRGYGRAMGTFNDPNQMGYWALLTVTCVLALREGRSLGAQDLVALALAGFVVFMSVSRAAMLGYGVLLVVVVASGRLRPRVVVGTLALACAAIVIAHVFDLGVDRRYQEVLAFVEERFASRGTANDSLGDRGYARLWQFPEHLLFGAGEGDYDIRFGLKNETHSTVGAILFGYGIIGFTLFGIVLFMLLRRAGLFYLALLVPIMIYGIAQQGVRFSLFWMLLAFIYVQSNTRNRADELTRFVPPR